MAGEKESKAAEASASNRAAIEAEIIRLKEQQAGLDEKAVQKQNEQAAALQKNLDRIEEGLAKEKDKGSDLDDLINIE